MPLYLTKSEDGLNIFIKANSVSDLSDKFEKLNRRDISNTSYKIIDNDHWFICKCIKPLDNFIEGTKYIYSYSDDGISVFYNIKSTLFRDPNKFLQYFEHISKTFIR